MFRFKPEKKPAPVGNFAESTGTILDALAEQLPGSAVFLAHLDEEERWLRIIHATGDRSFDLEHGASVDLDESFCIRMAAGEAPRLTNDAALEPAYALLSTRSEMEISSYAGVPLELEDGRRIGSLCAIAHDPGRYTEADLKLLEVMASIIVRELQRELKVRELEEETVLLRRLAAEDPLTGLLNRRAFRGELERAWSLCRRGTGVSSVIVADVDGLKPINDSAGHDAGDDALRLVASAFTAEARGEDRVARLGGDEFAVLLDGCATAADAERFCERVAARLRETRIHGFQVGVSFGWSTVLAAASPAEALAAADAHMYERKPNGSRSRVSAGPPPA